MRPFARVSRLFARLIRRLGVYEERRIYGCEHTFRFEHIAILMEAIIAALLAIILSAEYIDGLAYCMEARAVWLHHSCAVIMHVCHRTLPQGFGLATVLMPSSSGLINGLTQARVAGTAPKRSEQADA